MKTIKLSKSVVGKREIAALSRVIVNGYLGMGSYVKDFEEQLRNYLNAAHVVCVNSGTSALHLALMSLKLKPGEEVLVQSLTFVATFQAITAAGLKPVPCEINTEDCTIDLNDAGKKITGRTRVIIPVHYASRPGNLDKIYSFAKKHNLRVVEDAAHAFGCTYQGKKIGSFGDVICFSFDGIKNITSGEGGAVVTSDDDVAEYVRDARLLGVHKDTEKRFSGQRSWEFDVFHQGYRFHMSNLFAAIGMVQLKRFEKEFKPKRKKLAQKYNELLKNFPDIILFNDSYEETVPHMYPIRVLNGKRDAVRAALLVGGIECGVHYYPNHLLTYFGKRPGKLPVTEKIYGELLTLPLHPALTIRDQKSVCRHIKVALEDTNAKG